MFKSPQNLITIINPKKHYLIGILLLGLISGLSFTLLFSTIPYQLSEAKCSTNVIGGIFLATFPYCLKVIWAPFTDKYSIPFLCAKLGHRRGWAFTSQICLSLSMISFIIVDLQSNLYLTTIIILIVSFFAATQDIVLDAYRIERPASREELSLAITFSNVGFRLGMLTGGVGALYLSATFSWHFVYKSALIITLLGPMVILCIKEPKSKQMRHISKKPISLWQYFEVVYSSLLSLKNAHPNWLFIILFLFLYKSSDSVPMAMSAPLFIDLSFSSYEIASISKAYGLTVMIVGGMLGGIITSKIGIFRSIIISGIVQLLSPLMFMVLAIIGYNIPIFITTITIQNFCCGLAGTVIAIYLASLCNSEFVATQYSIIASISSLIRIILSAVAGFCAQYIPWPQFFLINTLFSVMFIVVFLKVNKNK